MSQKDDVKKPFHVGEASNTEVSLVRDDVEPTLVNALVNEVNDEDDFE